MEDFDLRVNIRDAKGRIIKHQPYRAFYNEFGERFERPKGSGNCWYKDGKPAGRCERNAKGTGWVHDVEADHTDFVPEQPVNLSKEVAKREETISELEARIRELEGRSIKAEQDGKEVEKRAEANERVEKKKAVEKKPAGSSVVNDVLG